MLKGCMISYVNRPPVRQPGTMQLMAYLHMHVQAGPACLSRRGGKCDNGKVASQWVITIVSTQADSYLRTSAHIKVHKSRTLRSNCLSSDQAKRLVSRANLWVAHSPTSFIIITQPERWYSFYCPMEGRRLSRPGWLVNYQDHLSAHSPVLTAPNIPQQRWSRPLSRNDNLRKQVMKLQFVSNA